MLGFLLICLVALLRWVQSLSADTYTWTAPNGDVVTLTPATQTSQPTTGPTTNPTPPVVTPPPVTQPTTQPSAPPTTVPTQPSPPVVVNPPPVTQPSNLWCVSIPPDPDGQLVTEASGLLGIKGQTYASDALIAGFIANGQMTSRGVDPTKIIVSNAIYLSSTNAPGYQKAPWTDANGVNHPADCTDYNVAQNAANNNGSEQILIRRGSYGLSWDAAFNMNGIASHWAMVIAVGVGGWNDLSAPDPVITGNLYIGGPKNFNNVLIDGYDSVGTGSASVWGISVIDGHINNTQNGNVLIQNCYFANQQSGITIEYNGSSQSYQTQTAILLNDNFSQLYGARYAIYTSQLRDCLVYNCRFGQGIGWNFAALPKDGSGMEHDIYSNPAGDTNTATSPVATQIQNPQHRYIDDFFSTPESIGLKDICGGAIVGDYFLACPMALVTAMFPSVVYDITVEGDSTEFDPLTSAKATSNAGQLITQNGTAGLALSDGPAGAPTSAYGWERGWGIVAVTQSNFYLENATFINKPGPTPNNYPWCTLSTGDNNNEAGDPPANCNATFTNVTVSNWWQSAWDSAVAAPNAIGIDTTGGGTVASVNYTGTNYLPGVAGGQNIISTTPNYANPTWILGSWGNSTGPAVAAAFTAPRSTLSPFAAVLASQAAFTAK